MSDQNLLCAHFRAGSPRVQFLHADNEDWPDCEDAQADRRLRWPHMSVGTFSHVEVHTDLIF